MTKAVREVPVEEWLAEQIVTQGGEFLSDLRDGLCILEIEKLIRASSRRFEQILLDALRRELTRLDDLLERPVCPVCTRRMHVNRKESLTLQLLEGEVEILRNYCECREHKFYCYPLNDALGLPGKGECTPLFGHDLCLLAAELPTSAAVRVLKRLVDRDISEGTVKAQVRRDGTALVELERIEAETLWPYDGQGHRRDVSRERLPSLRATPPPCGALIVTMDGVMANLGNDRAIRKEMKAAKQRQKARRKSGEEVLDALTSTWREVRQARIFRSVDVVEKRTKNGKIRRSLVRSETVSVVNDPLFFQKRLNAVLHGWDADRYSERVMIADGAPVLWDIGRTIVNPTVEILDIRHAQSHVHDCAKALFGQKTITAKRWGKRWSRSLKAKGPKKLLNELRKLERQEWDEEARKVLTNLISYVTEHYNRMDYPTFSTKGFPIGSGAIESANRQVVVDRCKRAGMRWSREGLQRLISLRAALLSGNWDRVCRAIRDHRSYSHLLSQRRQGYASTADQHSQARGTPAPPQPSVPQRPTTRAQKPPRRTNTHSRLQRIVPDRKMARLLENDILTSQSTPPVAIAASV